MVDDVARKRYLLLSRRRPVGRQQRARLVDRACRANVGKHAKALHAELVFDLADTPQITVDVRAKVPGPALDLGAAPLRLNFADAFGDGSGLEAYERLVLDVMRGDHTLFTRSDEIERLWEVSVPLLESPPPVRSYAPGTWGPNAIHQLIAPHAWRLPFERAWRAPTTPA